jgi:hypothetical protein
MHDDDTNHHSNVRVAGEYNGAVDMGAEDANTKIIPDKEN